MRPRDSRLADNKDRKEETKKNEMKRKGIMDILQFLPSIRSFFCQIIFHQNSFISITGAVCGFEVKLKN